MIPNEATMKYALVHANDDVRQLALRGCDNPLVDMHLALQQIQGRQIARVKLPSWANNDNIVYPPRLSLEQCSSQATAQYKQTVVHDLLMFDSQNDSLKIDNRKTVNGIFLDLTGGFGVDFAFMSQAFSQATYVERREDLCAVAKHNFTVLGLKGITVVCADGIEYLQSLDGTVDMIFVDPARRDSQGSRTYGISDCTPDVIPLMELLLRKSRFVMLKLSPMLDWRKAVADLGEHNVQQVHIVAVAGECKELLVILSAENSDMPVRLVCVNDDSREVFMLNTSPQPTLPTISPLHTTTLASSLFLYEPNAALMKAGLFTELAERYGVMQLAVNSHLFLSANAVPHFPGRRFVIEAVSTMNKRDLRQYIIPLQQANISVRNFPMSVAELRHRLKLSEGGSKYIFATTLATGERRLLICSKA
jgi:hypothetical protein